MTGEAGSQASANFGAQLKLPPRVALAWAVASGGTVNNESVLKHAHEVLARYLSLEHDFLEENPDVAPLEFPIQSVDVMLDGDAIVFQEKIGTTPTGQTKIVKLKVPGTMPSVQRFLNDALSLGGLRRAKAE